MKIKDLKNAIAGLPDNAEFLVSSDEELNSLMSRWEVAELDCGQDALTYCIYGFSGSEIDLDETVGKQCDNEDCGKTMSDLEYANGSGLCPNCRSIN